MAWQVCNKILHEFPARFARYDFLKQKGVQNQYKKDYNS